MTVMILSQPFLSAGKLDCTAHGSLTGAANMARNHFRIGPLRHAAQQEGRYATIQRKGLKKHRISLASAAGSSMAAKWPPLSIICHRRMSV